jgi:hypothetical protein
MLSGGDALSTIVCYILILFWWCWREVETSVSQCPGGAGTFQEGINWSAAMWLKRREPLQPSSHKISYENYGNEPFLQRQAIGVNTHGN